MNLFEVYPSFDVEPVKGKGVYVQDTQGQQYLDLYGGHAVMSVGHSHPHYIQSIAHQLNSLGFYSNSTQNSLQKQLAHQLTQLSGYTDYSLFLCNTGAEANESAFTLASYHTQRRKILTFTRGFHGRTSAAIAVTDMPQKLAPVNTVHEVVRVPLNDIESVAQHLKSGEVAAVIVEGIQGYGGIHVPNPQFLTQLQQLCHDTQTVLIADEIQSGYGRSGKFFAHQYTHLRPDIITVAKGMGNGFPIGGVLISPQFTPRKGMLGTTFGGNHLACAAGIAVLEIIEKEGLIQNAAEVGNYMQQRLRAIEGIKEVRGKGLMIGVEFDFPVAELRKQLVYKHHIFTGVSGTHVLRILPPLKLAKTDVDLFATALQQILNNMMAVCV
ncbi:aspartate aminotransferase family protein [Microscilla marina]|uniref:Acetylornithine aminotransferase n=1 Tax=Microscilla marina ATCC 23134 TaxID=313606 RepID=A1ZN84_MICM2|nr:aminotransferase class III-fold pyridoxal phosphate-dependent enzyme [Microscilla marina]EAY28265.1 acetylornithine aminotransferase [Microscilla marina ATCC 23134]